MSLDPTMERQTERMVGDLCSEFAGQFERSQIEQIMSDSVERVLASATVFEFVPLMAYRFTRERLDAIIRSRGDDAEGAWDVVFVSLSGGGHGHIASALTTLLSERRVSVHSAGTAVRAEIDPSVRAAIRELGIDPDEEFARPVTDEVLRAADVIVTMGHSVGVIEIPDGVRHEDWRIGDPIGAPENEIRRVRAAIAYRVRELLTELGVLRTDVESPTITAAAEEPRVGSLESRTPPWTVRAGTCNRSSRQPSRARSG